MRLAPSVGMVERAVEEVALAGTVGQIPRPDGVGTRSRKAGFLRVRLGAAARPDRSRIRGSGWRLAGQRVAFANDEDLDLNRMPLVSLGQRAPQNNFVRGPDGDGVGLVPQLEDG